MVESIRKHIVLIICIAFIIVLKIPHLILPYSWDEAWSYYPAIIEMAKNGPSLIPGSIPLLVSKGHPLFFYFSSSLWINLFSNEIWVVRLFPLLISVFTIIALYFLSIKHFSKQVAAYSVMLFSVQSLFVAQSTLVLPEVMLSLFLLLSLHFYLSEKFALYALFASLMVLTKETGLVFAFGFGLFFLSSNFKHCLHKEKLQKIGFLLVPLLAIILHLILQYRAFHSFFFKEHLDLIGFEFSEIKRILKSDTAILFTKYGRNTILFTTILSLVMILLSKQKIRHGKIYLLLLTQIGLLIAFSSVNFYTYRYMLPAFPLFILIAASLFHQAKRQLRYLFYPLLILMIAAPLYKTLTKKGNTDIDLGYVSYLPLHKEAVEYCEQQNWYEKQFSAEFNMLLALRDPFTGYHTGNRGFNVQILSETQQADILIMDSTGHWNELPEPLKKEFRLTKKFENTNHWVVIFERIDSKPD